MYTYYKNVITFASPFGAWNIMCSISVTLYLDSNFTNDNTPPMPLHDAHLGGFLFL